MATGLKSYINIQLAVNRSSSSGGHVNFLYVCMCTSVTLLVKSILHC